jgi:colicin import membrane protein
MSVLSEHTMMPTPTGPAATAAFDRGKHVSLALTLMVHLLLLAFLFYGVRWQTDVPAAVEVELVSEMPVSAPTTPAVTPPPRPQPPAPPVVRSTGAPQPQAVPPSRPDIALKDERKEKDKLKPKPVTPPPQPDPYQQQIDQELKRAEANRRVMEQRHAADRELNELRAAQQAAANAKAMADYMARIRGRIKGNIILPADIKGNPEAVFEVVQFPSGEILSVRLVKRSGDDRYDAAVERAILKSSPLPKPGRDDLFSRELKLTFHPFED